MAIAFRAAGAVSSAASGNISPALPTGTAKDDILVLMVASFDNVTHSVSGWTQVGSQTNSGVALHASAWLKRAITGESAPTVTHTAGSLIIGAIAGYSGVDPGVAIPGHNSAWNAAASSTITALALTPATNGAMCICIGAVEADASLTAMGVFGGSSPAMIERIKDAEPSGIGFILDDGKQNVAASTGDRTASTTTGTRILGIQISLENPFYPGLRTFYKGAVKELALQSMSNAQTGNGGVLIVKKNGMNYAVSLVPITDANASNVRVQTAKGTMAIRLWS
ncbi:MAG: hypothetical protein HY291_09550 [Planctomycetes bacterium]|nr:hypothetical protein [Planctomycetota bacterium]